MSFERFARLADCYEDSVTTVDERRQRIRNALTRGTHKRRCPVCGLKIRRPNHAEGDDHKRRSRNPALAKT